VVKPGASVSHVRDESPAEFCGNGTPATLDRDAEYR